MSNSCNQTPTFSNDAGIVENNNRFKLSPLQWSRFAGLGFHITFFAEFEIYFGGGRPNKTSSITSKMQLRDLRS